MPFSLSPAVLDIQVNDTIQWQNNDNTVHTVTTGTPNLGFDGRIDSGVISAGQTFSHKFDKAGVYGYYCLFHPWMTGLVSVGTGVPVSPILGISISTDKPSYHNGDTILISGQVSRFVPNEQVTVWITDPQGKGISMSHIETENGNAFSTSIVASGGLWIPGNSYKVFAQYGSRSSVAIATIQFGPENSTKANEQDRTIQDSNNIGINTSVQASYKSFHKKLNPDSNDFVTVQTEREIYKPSEQVKIYGSIWDGMFQEVGGAAYLATVPVSSAGSNIMTELVVVKVKDGNGFVISNKEAQVNNNGDYVVSVNLPQDDKGTYTVESAIETKQGLLSTLDASAKAKLNSVTNFVVTNPTDFVVPTRDGNFKVEVTSNSTVTNFAFKPEDKKISFDVQGETGTKGITDITIPKAVLSGEIQVLIDGNVQPYNLDNVIFTSDTAETTLEINYHHSTHTIDVIGTQAAVGSQTVPEFSSMASIVLAISTISIIALSTKIRHFHL
jgi:predicted secreted protein with PEFG-CTERM motif